MGADTFRMQFGHAELTRLGAAASLGEPVAVDELTSTATRARLRTTEVLITSWGCAPLDAGTVAAAVTTFSAGDCGPCPGRPQCTTSGKKRRQLTTYCPATWPTPRPPPAPQRRRSPSRPTTRRAGVEGTAHQAASHGARRARYRGLPKTRLDHAYMAVALNLIRLEAYWTGTPLDRRRTSHLARLELGLAALPPN